MVKKIKVKTKSTQPKKDSVSENFNENTSINEVEVNIPDTPTCVRCYVDTVRQIQTLNAMLMRFNVGKEHLVLQRVGYKTELGMVTEIDIAALHDNEYTVDAAEYETINGYLASFFKDNEINFKFIDFSDSYKNSADCHLAVDGLTTLCEYITIEKGTVSDELFCYLKERLNLPIDIVSIRIPISDSTGFFVTYDTEWVRANRNTDTVNDEKSDSENNIASVSIVAYTEDASDSIDLILNQFNSAIGNSMCDYTEKNSDSYYRIIKIEVTRNEAGNRLIDSLGWVNNVNIDVN